MVFRAITFGPRKFDTGALGIDLGTTNTVICDLDEGVVLQEPSVMLVDSTTARPRVVAVGQQAHELIGRAPITVETVRPVRDGVITDLETARTYLRILLARLAPRPWQRSRLRVVLCCPVGTTALERRALLETADEAGITHLTALDEPIAGAIGCGIDPLQPRAHLVVDLGGGTAEATAFCFGGILAHRCCRVAGDEMTVAVTHHLRVHHQLMVGGLTAEHLKIQTGHTDEPTLAVQGRDAATGRPRVARIAPTEVNEVLQPVIATIVQTLSGCLDELPPRTVGDVLAEGITLFGGAALVSGFTGALERAFGFPVKLGDRPLTCVAEGAAAALRNPTLLSAYGHT